MRYIPPEIVEEIKKIDLLTYFEICEPNELVQDSKTQFSTKTRSSLKMSNGLWNYFKKGVGGKNALDYFEKVLGYKFPKSAEYLFKILNGKIPACTLAKGKIKNLSLILPEKNENNIRAKQYLKSRGIDEEIIQKCIENKLIYEEKHYHNVVFIGYDELGNAKYAGCRGTNESKYKGDATGSNKMYSFRLESEEKTDKLFVFEGAIDLLSYATLFKLYEQKWEDKTMISLSGVYQPAKIIEQSKVPIALQNYLDNHSEVKEIVLCFDNDEAGRNATKALQIVLPNKYRVVDKPPRFCKDYNEYLCRVLEIRHQKNIKKIKRERLR